MLKCSLCERLESAAASQPFVAPAIYSRLKELFESWHRSAALLLPPALTLENASCSADQPLVRQSPQNFVLASPKRYRADSASLRVARKHGSSPTAGSQGAASVQPTSSNDICKRLVAKVQSHRPWPSSRRTVKRFTLRPVTGSPLSAVSRHSSNAERGLTNFRKKASTRNPGHEMPERSGSSAKLPRVLLASTGLRSSGSAWHRVSQQLPTSRTMRRHVVQRLASWPESSLPSMTQVSRVEHRSGEALWLKASGSGRASALGVCALSVIDSSPKNSGRGMFASRRDALHQARASANIARKELVIGHHSRRTCRCHYET